MNKMKNSRLGSVKFIGKTSNSLHALIAVLVIGYVFINFIKIVYFLSNMTLQSYENDFLSWILVPGSLGKLAQRPWTILSYMIAHDGVWHMISNILWLWAFGYILHDLTKNKHIVPIFIYGGVAGAIAFILTINGFGVLSAEAATIAPLQGAGAAIMAVAVATTILAPNYRIFRMLNGGIPIWVLTLVFAIIDYATIASANAGVGLAHLTGGLVGFLYIKSLGKGQDWGEWMHNANAWFGNLFEPTHEKMEQEKKRREAVYYQIRNTVPIKKTSHITQQRVDELLDKIGQKGFETLTTEEKEYLQRASNEEV